MSRKQKILLCVFVMAIFIMSLSIFYGENGLTDLILKGKERERIKEKNESIRQGNINLYREIERLKTDPVYLEEIVRKETKMVKPGEIVVRMKNDKEAEE